ncbi:MAG: outer membrane protein assembly factor BamD [Nibricoccus sp.]
MQRRFLLALLVLPFLLAGHAVAELVWTPQGGWRIEGGALAGVGGSDAKNALGFMNKARAAEEKGSKGSAIRSYTKVAKRYPNSVYAAEAQYRIGNLRLARKQYIKAFDAFQVVALRYPQTGRFDEIIGKQYHIASSLLDGARGRVWGLFPGFTNREKAIEQLEILLIEAPFSDYAPLALLSIARGHRYFKNTEEALDALDRMVNNYPQSVLTTDAYLDLGRTHASLVEGPYYDQGSTRDAITYFEDFMILFPSDNNVGIAEKGLTDMKRVMADSKMKIADFYFKRRDNYKAARIFYNEAITVYPDSEIAAKARARLAEVEAASNKAAAAALPPPPPAK